MTTNRERFQALVAAGDACDLARGALEIARIGHPDLDPTPSLHQLDALADSIRPRLTDGVAPDLAVREVARHLFGADGFHGNTDDYYDPRNSFLNEVLDRRTGIPITLGIILLETCTRLGLPAGGVGFPGHFLVRVDGASGPVLLDPFFGGRVLDSQELLGRLRAFYEAGGGPAGSNLQRVLPQALQRTSRPAILERVLSNLLRIYLQRDEPAAALTTVELLLVLVPNAAEPTRVRGLLYERLECYASAVTDLRRYLALAPQGPYRDEVRARLARLDTRSVLH
jgi:regulator of sirC expression with transglutaminase-like and TPR domain